MTVRLHMRATRAAGLTLLALGMAVSACSRGDREPELLTFNERRGTPDEFRILPGLPIEMPEDMAALPAPTPGGSNRTDADPEADLILALGGNPALDETNGQTPASASGVIAYTTRYGVTPGVRETLAAEDLEYRRRNNGRFLERLFNQTVYFDAYEPQSLNQVRELNRFRAAGVDTVAAPPDPVLAE